MRGTAAGDALRAEWIKLCTLTSTLWLMLALVAGTVAVSAVVLAAVSEGAAQGLDAARTSLAGVAAGQAVVVVLAVLSMSNEYGTGMVVGTLTAMPRRLVVLAAKGATLAGLTALGGALAGSACLSAGRLILAAHGYTAASGSLSPEHGSTIRAVTGSVLYLVLVALLSLGIATAVRDAATAIGLVLGLLYLFPLLAQTVSSPTWHRHLEQVGPMTAGLAVQATTHLSALPISPWAGLGVLGAWSVAALLVGGTLLCLRDV